MYLSGILLRWYRSFNVLAVGPADLAPPGGWNQFRNQSFPFISVPLDKLVTTVVGANESGKSHLLSAITKSLASAEGALQPESPDFYDIKDICRYCGFSALEDVWPQIGIELSLSESEAEVLLKTRRRQGRAGPDNPVTVTAVLNGFDPAKYAALYRGDTQVRVLTESEWRSLTAASLPRVASLDARLALPNEIHIDQLLDLYEARPPKPVIDGLRVQDLWREIENIDIPAGGPLDAAAAQRVVDMRSAIERSTHEMERNEQSLAYLLFSRVLGVKREHLQRMRKYSGTERGYVSWVNDELNSLIDRELDISRYWDQDEDFKLTVNYKAGTFHFQITDRTGATYTFNERSSGLKYFLSYYIQAKALEKARHERGLVILMDEPDNFLSASGQRSLLRVFESLVSTKTSEGQCQLVYTTHSPFLINRNFPGRIRLVRKGDGSEGTQYVARSAVRRFEPVRSALSIDAADTLFLGSMNVVVEGPADQKLITAAMQRFGDPRRADEMLDLNKVTIISAGGAPHALKLVSRALNGDERTPVVVVVFDGDPQGVHFAAETAKLINPKQVMTLAEVESPSGVWRVLEDMIPVDVVAFTIGVYAARFGVNVAEVFDGSGPGDDSAEKVVSFCRKYIPDVDSYEDIEIRSDVVDVLVDLLDEPSSKVPGVESFASNIRALCGAIQSRLDLAERIATGQSLKRAVGFQIDTFLKRFPNAASKGDLRKLLADLKQGSFGRSDDLEQTRRNLDMLTERADAEVYENVQLIDLDTWRFRLKRFKDQPWANVKDWSVIAPPASSAVATSKNQKLPPGRLASEE